MPELGYSLSSEEHAPNDLVRYAHLAEDAGFTFATISDHFHPWIDRQGQSPFVWSVIGGISQVTERLHVVTGVTCPTARIHPAIIAQAAATVASMMPGRFSLGVGTGENLNEHILGDHWPPHDIRSGMLEEAVEIIRLLWEGGTQSHWGEYYVVENARIYTLPDQLPPIYVAAAGPKAATLAGRIGDGLITTSADKELLKTFDDAGGKGKPRYSQVTVCWAANEKQARKTVHEIWPIAGMKGEVQQELPTPAHFEQVAQLITEDDVAEIVACGPDPKRHLELIQKHVDAGFDFISIHQIRPEQEGFFKFYQKEILPKYNQVPVGTR